jgi:hypothetical protein
MALAGRILTSLVGAFVLWLAVTMAVSPALIVPVPKHGESPQRVEYERTVTTEVSRYVAAGLLGFFGLTLVVAPWRKRGRTAVPSDPGAPRQG